ncbi:heme lyase CcmF/NrfE family subunit [Chloroflexota bacterium]
MADIGYITLLLALLASIYSAISFIFGAKRRTLALLISGRNSLLVATGLISISVALLVYALLTHDFQIEYVTSYTSRDLPFIYLISTLWAGNDGSLLFWAWLISLFAVVIVFQRRGVGKDLVPYASSVVMFTQAFFLILLLTVSNPFHKLAFVPVDGRGLNPMLENPGMIIHPPTILAGYVGFTVSFAFAIAALLTSRLGNEWIIAVRRWILISWLLLGVGNIIGAWWAYVELGWGGYWAWDPVENAGLMPWLTATAFLHSIMMQRRKAMLKVWNMVLIIITFNLAIFGTFLTRSGVLSSVHTYADSSLGIFFLVFIGITLFGALGLLYYRRGRLKDESEMTSLVSRESTFLLNNSLLVGAAFIIFLGTIFPLISEAVRGIKIVLDESFFNRVVGPLLLTVITLIGVCTVIGWRRTPLKRLFRSLLWPLLSALSLGVALLILGTRGWYAITAFSLCFFVLSSVFWACFQEVKSRHKMKNENFMKAFWKVVRANRPRYGGYIVHIAIILIAIGVIGSSFYAVEKEATLMPGESMTIKDYTLTYENTEQYQTQSKQVTRSIISVYNQGKLIGRLTPEKYLHRSYAQAVTEVSIRTTPLEDLYVILVGWNHDGAATFNVLVNPLVIWIGIGGGLIVLGGLIAFWPDRQKLPIPTQASGGFEKEGDLEDTVERQALELH